jgi:hypothetical protein
MTRSRKGGKTDSPSGLPEATGGFTRPQAEVLAPADLIPSANLIRPAPNCFTHETVRDQPYYYDSGEVGRSPDGTLPKGAQVVLLVYGGGTYCRVVDARGLYVAVEYAGLAALP